MTFRSRPVSALASFCFGRTIRTGATALVVVVLAMMNAGQPSGQTVPPSTALDFNGTTQYVTFGPAAGTGALGATNFTLELWFKREGAGTTTTTSGPGGGGLETGAVPLVAKGRGEADGSLLDMNYFLGLHSNAGNYFLAADFEEGTAQSNPGLNHAVISSTAIALNTWYHAAASYDSTTRVFSLYLNGVLNTSITVPAGLRAPQFDSTQHASIGSALNSGGTAAGFFNGVIDEVRIWNVARSAIDISANKDVELTSGTGLIGRWGLNEGTGTTAANSVAGRPNGTLTNGPLWVAPPDTTGPAAPQGLEASIGNGLVTLAWNANGEADLAGYRVYRSVTSPVAATGTPLSGPSPLTSPIFTDATAVNGLQYFYTVTAVDAATNASLPAAEVAATPNAFAGAGLQFNGSNQYVTFGQAAGLTALGAQTFTLETWFKRTGTGVGTSTGTGGFETTTAIPLVTKGRGEAENSNVDMNYFLGLHATSGVLIADFEDTAGGGNHPVSGSTVIPISTTAWHHAAVTYDGTTWRLYLDGNLEATDVENATPRFDSIQHAAIASALTSGGTAAGFFNGLMDEVRIWDHARSQVNIQAGMTQEITSAAGLIGRWALNEASGSTLASTARPISGTAVATPRWTAGHPYPPDTLPPGAPVNLTAAPGNGQVSLSWTPNTEPDLAGYNVFRRTPAGSFGAALNGATLLTSAAYVDTAVTNETDFVYAVNAVDVFANPSALSNEATATPSTNLPPTVVAGPDRTVTLSSAATLAGSASDDGPPAGLTVLWTVQSGPGTVSFANPAAAATTATFSQTGFYVLRLTATDGVKSAFDDMTVTVTAPVLVGAGDIAPNCVIGDSLANAEATAVLLDGIPGAVFTLGDNAYVNGSATEFATCYGPTWGRHKGRTRPASGNHDYQTANAAGYYDYFNGSGVQIGAAGNRTNGGYYSYNVGNWHVVVLNSECTSLWSTTGCAAGSAQEQWLRADLAASPTNNIIAMWHRPRFSSSSGATTHAYLQPLYQALYDYGTDIVLGGHWHNYERLAPMDPDGDADPAFGIRSFVIGTGGIPLTGFGTILGTSEARNSTDHGVIRFTLHDSSYDWQFVPVAGDTFTDSGSGAVHGLPSGNLPPGVNAGPDQTVPTGAASLAGSVADDGLVGPLAITWSKLSGPGIVTFGDATAATTSAGFTVAGDYVLRLAVDDGQFVRADTVTISVTTASGNLPAIVNAGADQTITLPASVALGGTVSDDGLPGDDVTTTWSRTSGPGTVSFADPTSESTTASFSVAGTYILRLSADDGELPSFDEVTITVNAAVVNSALDLAGTNAYVTLGPAPALGVTTMTLEAWFRRDGAGVATSTGSGGITAVPIVSKGMAEEDTPANLNMNFFLGIRFSDGVLGVDFEDTANGANHPVVGVTPVPADGTWHHAAATYDGTTWRLYLDGALDQTTVVGSFTPESTSIQHAVIGSALDSDGNTGSNPQGFFNGAIDEVRIWNRALPLSEIQANANVQLSSGTGLVARWGFNDGPGTTVADSTAGPVNGTIAGSGYAWVPGAPFSLVFNQAPLAPTPVSPANAAGGQSTSPTLEVAVADPDGTPLSVTFYGRTVPAGSSPDFTLVALPDTQHYSDDATRAATFTAQTQWIVNNRAALNIPFVTHLGDIVEHIDAAPVEWTRANTAMSLLDGQVPYGLAPGNHDMNSAGVGTNYDLTFPVSRFDGNLWYGGYLGKNLFGVTDPIDRQNKDNFELFSAGGMDFVIIHLEYDMPPYAVAWANRVLAAYPTRRAIISTHLFLNASGVRPTTVLNRPDGTPAATVWSQLVFPNCSVFLVLNGHYPGEANRTDPNACGRPVHQLASDYQSRVNGGDGWLRYMTFKPAENKIYVYTYSPTLGSGAGLFETDTNSQFVLDYDMQGVPFAPIATTAGVASGSTTSTVWAGRAANAQYEWYATASDGQQTATGPTWTFTTAAPSNLPPTATPQSVTTPEDVATGVTLGGTDPENAGLSFALGTLPAHGTLSGTAPALTYTPAANFAGPDSFTFTVSDGTQSSAPATITVTVTAVNDPPIAVDDTATTAVNAAATISAAALVANDSDDDGDSLTVSAVSNAVNGSVGLASGVVTFTPSAGFSGTAGFDYTVSDGTATDTGHVTVTVSGGNASPVAADDSVTTAEDVAAPIAAATLLANDSDGDGDTLVITAVSGAVNGVVGLVGSTITFTPAANFTGTAGFDYTVSDATATDLGHVTVMVSGDNDPPVAADDTATTAEDVAATIAAATLLANDSDGDGDTLVITAVSGAVNGVVGLAGSTVTFTPVANFSGVAGFDYTVSDGAQTDLGHVTVTVSGVSDSPVAVDDSATTAEDVAATIAAATLLANDSDGDGDTLVITAVSGAVNGVVGLAGSTVTFTPAVNFTGTAGFDYTVSDGAQTDLGHVTVTHAPGANDPPVVVDDSATTAEDVAATIAAATLLANDSDGDGDTLVITAVSGAVNGVVGLAGSTVTFTPTANFSGTAGFDYTVSDGSVTDVGHVTVTVTAVNDPPVAVDDTATAAEDAAATISAATLAGNDTDAEGATLTVTAVTNPVNGTVGLAAGVVTFTPTAGFSGPAGFDYTVSDGTLSDIGHVTVTVTAVNDPPVAVDDTATTAEDAAATISAATLAGNDTDAEGATLTVTAVTNPVNGTVGLAAGVVTFTPTANFSGPAGFDYTVSDGTATDLGHVTVTVTAVNDPPTVSDIANLATTAGAPVTVGFSVSDLESLATLVLTGTSTNQALLPNGNIGFGGNGASRTVTLTPLAGQSGSTTVTVSVSDGAATATDTFVLSVGNGPAVQVLSPNGGDLLYTGSPYLITWSAVAGDAAVTSYAVQYSTNNGASFSPVPGCTGLAAALTQCTWAAPVATTAGRIRVVATDASGRSGADDSNAPFTVAGGTATVAVTGPAGNTVLLVGALRPITWTHNLGTATFAARFTVEVSRQGLSGPWVVIAPDVPQLTPTTGRFDWLVTGPVSGSVRFRVRPANFTVQATNNGNTSIAAPVLALSAPLSGETWTVGKRATFKWTTNLGDETIGIEISRDGGATWQTVVAAVTAGAKSGQYAWTVTGPSTTQMRARVVWTANPTLQAGSTGNNTIR